MEITVRSKFKKVLTFTDHGCFKYKGIAWENWSTPGVSETSEEFLFVETLCDTYLFQHVLKPTRIRMSQEPSILDLIITNEEGMIGKSDHIILTFNFRTYYCHKYIEKTVFSYEKGNYIEMQNYVQNHEWEKDLQAKDINGSRITFQVFYRKQQESSYQTER